jgi:hypothetical protein
MIKTWQQRCEEHPGHEGIVTEQMIRERMQEEIDALRQAIEQAEKQEPVIGTKTWFEDGKVVTQHLHPSDIYASDISQERVDETAKGKHGWAMQKMVEENERLGLYNEPVAWIRKEELAYMSAAIGQGIFEWKTNLGLKPQAGDVPLYTAPQKKEWVGLTQAEFDQAVGGLENLEDCWHAIEAKLKEKNCPSAD